MMADVLLPRAARKLDTPPTSIPRLGDLTTDLLRGPYAALFTFSGGVRSESEVHFQADPGPRAEDTVVVAGIRDLS